MVGATIKCGLLHFYCSLLLTKVTTIELYGGVLKLSDNAT